jgi:hypothetical protein
MCSIAWSSLDWFLATMQTLAPCCASLVARALPIPLDPPVIKTVYMSSCQHIYIDPSGCDKLTLPSTGKCLLDENNPIAALATRMATSPITIGLLKCPNTVMIREQRQCEHFSDIQYSIHRVLESSQTNKPNTALSLDRSQASFSSFSDCSSTTTQINTNVARNHPRISSPPPNIPPGNPLRKTRPLHPTIPPPLLIPQPHISLQPPADITDARVSTKCCKI